MSDTNDTVFHRRPSKMRALGRLASEFVFDVAVSFIFVFPFSAAGEAIGDFGYGIREITFYSLFNKAYVEIYFASSFKIIIVYPILIVLRVFILYKLNKKIFSVLFINGVVAIFFGVLFSWEHPIDGFFVMSPYVLGTVLAPYLVYRVFGGTFEHYCLRAGPLRLRGEDGKAKDR